MSIFMQSSRSLTDGLAFQGPKVTTDSLSASRLLIAFSWTLKSSSVRSTQIMMVDWRAATASALAIRIRTWNETVV